MRQQQLNNKETNTMKNAVIYARVSSESQEENTSLDMQIEKSQSYANTYDLHINEVFQDVGTGAFINRTGFAAMMDYIDTYTINAIIVYKLDRLHRSLKNLLVHKDELEANGISIVSVSEQIDTTTANGKLFFNIIGSFAEFEKDVINQRTSQGKSQKILKGLFTAGKIPYGYRIEKSEVLTVVEEEAANVKEAFTLAAEGKSLRKIAVSVFGAEKKYGMVSYMLKNTAYIGKLRQENDSIVSIPRIISTQLFNKVN
jgi:site-specific DNA recombinase